MIEQAELDRLQQRQLREHSPKLQAMVRLLNNIRDITANKTLTAKKRLNSISGLQIQFDKLKEDTGLLSGAIPPKIALEAPTTFRPVQPTVEADKGIRPVIEPKKKRKRNNMKIYC